MRSGARREVQIRGTLATSRNGLNVLLELESPRPGAKVWLPLSQCDFGRSEYASPEYSHQVVRIPVWLFKRTFTGEARQAQGGGCSHDAPF